MQTVESVNTQTHSSYGRSPITPPWGVELSFGLIGFWQEWTGESIRIPVLAKLVIDGYVPVLVY